MADQNINRLTKNAVIEKIKKLSCMLFALLWCSSDNNLASSWLCDLRMQSMSRPFPILFCLGAVWKRHSSCWRVWALMILSGTIFLNTSVNIADRISLRPPRWWGCSIFEVVCWRKTAGEKVRLMVIRKESLLCIHETVTEPHPFFQFHWEVWFWVKLVSKQNITLIGICTLNKAEFMETSQICCLKGFAGKWALPPSSW